MKGRRAWREIDAVEELLCCVLCKGTAAREIDLIKINHKIIMISGSSTRACARTLISPF